MLTLKAVRSLLAGSIDSPYSDAREMKRFRTLVRLSPVLLFALVLAAEPARAACSGPAGNEGDMTYNHTFHTMQFCDGTNWYSMKGGGGGSNGLTLISAQTASNSASLQFTSLPTSYNTLFLNCTGIQPTSTAGVNFQLQFGEGATPTWETANYHSVEFSGVDSGGSSIDSSNTSGSAIPLSFVGANTVGSWSSNETIWISNVPSSTLYKSIHAQGDFYFSPSYMLHANFLGGAYTGDVNPVTAIQLFYSAGNISVGSCRLYGMN